MKIMKLIKAKQNERGNKVIYGIGTDITDVSRFEKWVKNGNMINRFFKDCEIVSVSQSDIPRRIQGLCEHYAARFAAKEAFSKALGTGFAGLELSDFGIENDSAGKPQFRFGEKTKKLLFEKVGENAKIHVSLSHEKKFATAFVVIEKL